MNKQAYFKMMGLQKKADSSQQSIKSGYENRKEKSEAASAGIGTYPQATPEWQLSQNPNTYQQQLLGNFGISSVPHAMDVLGEKSTELLPALPNKENWREVDKLIDDKRRKGLPRNYDDAQKEADEKMRDIPITQGDLQTRRAQQSRSWAERLFGKGTDQLKAAIQYLKARGRQNQQRFRKGVLHKNLPSEIKMPQIIPDYMRGVLDRAGKIMVRNGVKPSYQRNQQLA